eukprot:CAMPEP_0179064680 /NCGR_PEP_ID=MMETSP0796-20121207/28070_1 /TAXON_ID=73915 /ORGANISM="Pyrodinium bahamense, Strain pbaha01" /LENGTH=89 /DNA_ID=CAMNT_0020761629 /DNA_START=191 /DNA_END=460 /DNA_ORIENTATION=-
MCVITQAKQLGFFATVMENIFPFPKKQYAFNLTHILLFAILISLLSMAHHPAQDMVQAESERELRKQERAEKKENEKKEKEKEKAAKGE